MAWKRRAGNGLRNNQTILRPSAVYCGIFHIFAAVNKTCLNNDIARYRTSESPGYVIQNWLRNRNTIRYLGLWERLHNIGFNCLEFEAIESQSGLNSFALTPKTWIERTGAIGIKSKQGRYAATFAHQEIAFEFASWISPEFKLYIVEDYLRLKTDENSRLSLNWNLNRAG